MKLDEKREENFFHVVFPSSRFGCARDHCRARREKGERGKMACFEFIQPADGCLMDLDFFYIMAGRCWFSSLRMWSRGTRGVYMVMCG